MKGKEKRKEDKGTERGRQGGGGEYKMVGGG